MLRYMKFIKGTFETPAEFANINLPSGMKDPPKKDQVGNPVCPVGKIGVNVVMLFVYGLNIPK